VSDATSGTKKVDHQITGILLPLCLLHGCGGFAFYEDTKVAIAIKVDPKAPDPVEISASFKESVFALVPVGRSASESGPPTLPPFTAMDMLQIKANENHNL
jgi:hypothetical protein